MAYIKLLAVSFFIVCLAGCSEKLTQPGGPNDNNGADQSTTLVGKALPTWQDGYLDIHAINTGRGESSLYIFPDGTTMLVDAAGSLLPSTDPIPPTAPKPNAATSAGEVIVNYINYFIKPASNDKLNYILVSHFHPDHMGNVTEALPMSATGNFRMGGITEVGARKPFETIIDRGYPDYNYPTNIASSVLMSNYIKFVKWAKASYGATAEQFDVGKMNQIVQRRNPLKYPNFQVRNIVGNGKVWTGAGTGATNTLPSVEELLAADANENIFSIGFEISYGKFNYFCGGDLQYNGKSTHSWKDIETPVSKVMTPVDAMKANHHGTSNCNGEAFVNKLAPNTVFIHPWRDVQPNPETIGRFYAANSTCNIFTTNMTEPNKLRLGDLLAKIRSVQGHVVLRVNPGGDQYYVYVLDDTNEQYKVKKVFGPYKSS